MCYGEEEKFQEKSEKAAKLRRVTEKRKVRQIEKEFSVLR
jgi:hypothetical protein